MAWEHTVGESTYRRHKQGRREIQTMRCKLLSLCLVKPPAGGFAVSTHLKSEYTLRK